MWQSGLLALLLLVACSSGPSTRGSASPERVTAAIDQRHLQITGTIFLTPDGQIFHWRGITAFRLLDYIADKREAEVERYLAWAASQRLTVVRVLGMGAGFINLRPEDGRAALPRLLELAKKHGIYVEVVALAGTADIPVQLEEQVVAIGRVLAEHSNGILEIANEPVHPTQAPDVHKPEVLKALASRVAADVPIALGSVERGDGFAAGDYITWHAPRDMDHGRWGHVLRLVEGAAILERWKKPVVSDEPIGAGPRIEPERRDNVPARFRAAALLTRLTGVGATFHYDAGLQAQIPTGSELACFQAWNEAWTLLPADIEQIGAFRMGGSDGAVVRDYARETLLGVYERTDRERGWVLVIDDRGDAEPALRLAPGWRVSERKRLERAWLLTLQRSAA